MTPPRWSPARGLALVLITVVWVSCGVGVYLALSGQRSTLAAKAKKPGEEQTKNGPLQRLPGTLYLVQDRTLYRLQKGTFTPILAPSGQSGWTQPAISPDGQSLIVVRRDYSSSDLYQVDTAGHVQRQLTHNANNTIELNHWALYPRLGADGQTLWLSYDPKDRFNNYNVVMAVWSIPLGAAASQLHKWTTPHDYTGGDIQPVPLASGGVIYTKYALQSTTNRIMSQLWISTRAGTVGRALTPADADCSQAALSPDQRKIAMICTGGTQIATLEVASFDGTNIGPRQILVAGQLAAQPTWAPDGDSLVYLAAQGLSGHFQLWLQQVPVLPPPTPTPTEVAARGTTSRGTSRVAAARTTPTPTPLPSGSPSASPTPLAPPLQLTNNLDFDATSTIAWHA